MSGAPGSQVWPVDTPLGPGRFFLDAAPDAVATLVLGHGAGGGVGASDLELLARHLPPAGVCVVRFEQPWRTAGGRVAVRPERLDLAWRAALDTLLTSGQVAGRLFLGGRSAGARAACRTASAYEVTGVVCLAFPLHLPGRPERSRLPELLAPSAPRLVLQGTRDAFGTAAEVQAGVAGAPDVEIVALAGADHGFRLLRGGPLAPGELREVVVAAVRSFVARNIAGPAGLYPP